MGPRERERYARHLSLPQIGDAGQARLLAAAFEPVAGADARAWAVTQRYLERAGCVIEEGGSPLAVPAPDEVARVAGDPALLPAARALVGALCAVDAIRESLALPGRPQPWSAIVISSEDV